METFIYHSLLKVHVLFGFVSLILFWLPVALKKGSKWHNRIGKWYVYAMWIVVSSAAVLCIQNLIVGKVIIAAFLGFISIITAKPLWHGIAVLRIKKGVTTSYYIKRIVLESLLILGGIGMLAFGVYIGVHSIGVLMIIFGIIGVLDTPALIRIIRKRPEKVNWMKEHIGSMLVSGIAAYTAFFVFGAREFLMSHMTGMWTIIPWITPTIIGVLGIRWAEKRFLKKDKSVTATV